MYVCPITRLFIMASASAGSPNVMIVNRTVLVLLNNLSMHSKELRPASGRAQIDISMGKIHFQKSDGNIS